MVTVYSMNNCVQCTATYRHLTKRGIEFDVLDVGADERALAAVRALGYSQAPVVVTESGEHWSGFDPSRIDALAA